MTTINKIQVNGVNYDIEPTNPTELSDLGIILASGAEIDYCAGLEDNIQKQLNDYWNIKNSLFGQAAIKALNNGQTLYAEMYLNLLMIYGTHYTSLVSGWNIISTIPINFRPMFDLAMSFTIINNSSTSSDNQFLQARVYKENDVWYLSVFSFDTINDTQELHFCNMIPCYSTATAATTLIEEK